MRRYTSSPVLARSAQVSPTCPSASVHSFSKTVMSRLRGSTRFGEPSANTRSNLSPRKSSCSRPRPPPQALKEALEATLAKEADLIAAREEAAEQARAQRAAQERAERELRSAAPPFLCQTTRIGSPSLARL